jgi:hypothetical protein
LDFAMGWYGRLGPGVSKAFSEAILAQSRRLLAPYHQAMPLDPAAVHKFISEEIINLRCPHCRAVFQVGRTGSTDNDAPLSCMRHQVIWTRGPLVKRSSTCLPALPLYAEPSHLVPGVSGSR